jgi:hypothetical protein
VELSVPVLELVGVFDTVPVPVSVARGVDELLNVVDGLTVGEVVARGETLAVKDNVDDEVRLGTTEQESATDMPESEQAPGQGHGIVEFIPLFGQ